MKDRYYVREDRMQHGCCYSATVHDSQTQDPHEPIEHRDQLVCECPDVQVAQKIADALNAMEKR